jgi:hypothetical protein
MVQIYPYLIQMNHKIKAKSLRSADTVQKHDTFPAFILIDAPLHDT